MRPNFRPRWYGADILDRGVGRKWSGLEKKGVVQSKEFPRLPEELIRLAQDEYDIQHSGQPYERMQQRGGLGIIEIIMLLADALERERHDHASHHPQRS